MKYEIYTDLRIAHDLRVFEFVSIGRYGAIKSKTDKPGITLKKDMRDYIIDPYFVNHVCHLGDLSTNRHRYKSLFIKFPH